jgi:hypothetical protein
VISGIGVDFGGQDFECFVHVASAVVADAQVLLIERCGCTAAAISETGVDLGGQSLE